MTEENVSLEQTWLEINLQPERRIMIVDSTYCDSCMNAAYDEVGDGIEVQTMVLDQMADLLPDHLCDHGEEPDIPCDCAAHSFNRISA